MEPKSNLQLIIDFLNEALALDDIAISTLFRDPYVVCNIELALSKDVEIASRVNDQFAVGVLGLINGIAQRLHTENDKKNRSAV